MRRSSGALAVRPGAGPLTAIGAGGLVVAVAATNGGYFPVSWGWSGLLLAWVGAVTLLLRDGVALSRLAGAFVLASAAFVAWGALSTLWSLNPSQSVLEVERNLVYVAGALVLTLVARERYAALLAGCLGGITIICAYSLLTRLLPDRLAVFDPVAGYRLSTPVGYWNALGLFAAFGSLLAFGFVHNSATQRARNAAGAALVVLLPTLYFTFSRGAWIALAVGAVVALSTDPRRLSLLAVAAFSLPAPVLAVAICWKAGALNSGSTTLKAATDDGHRVLILLVALAVVAAAAVAASGAIRARMRPSPAVQRWADRALAAGATAVIVAALASGAPTRIWDAFSAPPPATGGELNKRLFNLSGSGRVTQWRVAALEYRAEPMLGSGSGSFERYWNRHRLAAGKIRDVHNLYLEVLAELGPIGLVLLMIFLGAPLVALRRARRQPLVPCVAGAYVAYLVHAAIDWDWEMPVLTLLALACGATLITAARGDSVPPVRPSLRAGAVVVASLIGIGSFLGLVGNLEVSRASSALRAGDWFIAASRAQAAERWQPWSPEPLRLLGEARLAQGRRDDARRAFAAAVAKDGADWRLWFDLARAARARERTPALARASMLNPLSPEIAEFRAELGIEQSSSSVAASAGRG
jgi:hypothetical protein